jgi:catechol 2,3-dioxygenase-like lactoylglutathione lyase family enzyme
MSPMAVACTCCSMSVDWWVRLRSRPDLPICHDCLAGLNVQRDGQLQLLSGTWLITGFEPIFKVADMTRSVAWYESAGFEVSFHDDTYAFVRRDRDLTIHLAQAAGDDLPGHSALYIHCQDADRVAEEWRRAGLEVDGPRDEDYGKREGSTTDADGNVIRFGSSIRSSD